MLVLCKKGFILFFLSFLLILLSSLVSAVPPETIVSVGDEGIEIEYPTFIYQEKDQPMEYHFHFFNKSNGYPITDNINCSFHLYNRTGSQIWEMDKSKFDGKFDMIFNTSKSNFSKAGVMSYILQCNSTLDGKGGFVSHPFEITEVGTEEKPYNMLIMLIIILSFMYLLLIVGIWKDELVSATIASMGLIVIGIFLHINGVGDIKNYLTDAFALINIGIGTFILITGYGQEAISQLRG